MYNLNQRNVFWYNLNANVLVKILEKSKVMMKI